MTTMGSTNKFFVRGSRTIALGFLVIRATPSIGLLAFFSTIFIFCGTTSLWFRMVRRLLGGGSLLSVIGGGRVIASFRTVNIIVTRGFRIPEHAGSLTGGTRSHGLGARPLSLCAPRTAAAI